MEERGRIPVLPPISDPLPSYWHVPTSPLASHFSPVPSDITYDYIIIGSGISGTLIAYNLLNSQPSAKIVMLEARTACGGATGRNGGHTKAASYRTYLQHREELGKEESLKIARLEYANILATHRMAKELNLECESVECNTVDLIYDQETFESGKKGIGSLRADAEESEREEGRMAWYKIYEKQEAMVKFWAADMNTNPAVKEEENLAGAFEYRAGRVNAYRFATGILQKLVEKGMLLRTNSPVGDVQASSDADGSYYSVTTPNGSFRARQVILAINGYTPYLLKSLQGAIVPLRGQITAQQPGKDAKFPDPLPTTYSFIYKSGYEYMIPRPLPNGGQHIVIGGGLGREPERGVSEFGTVDDGVLNASVSQYLKGSLVGYFGSDNWGEDSGEEPKSVVQEWTGIMGATADGRPFVGEVPGKKGLWISAGFNGHGMVLCLKSAEAIVRLIGGSKAEEIEWFPQSFLISEERSEKSVFSGRTDMHMPETREGPVSSKI